MGNRRNRSQKRKRNPPSKKLKKIQDGGPNYNDPGPSSKKLSKNTAIVSGILGSMDTASKHFDNILKCPGCGGKMSSHTDTKNI